MQPSSSTQASDTSSTALKNDDGTAASRKASPQTASPTVPEGAKILPPTSPVNVPRMPPPAPQPAELPDLSDPRGNTTSWADSPEADPHKKTARTSINNG